MSAYGSGETGQGQHALTYWQAYPLAARMRRAAAHAKRTAEAYPKAVSPHVHHADRSWTSPDTIAALLYTYCSCGAMGTLSRAAAESDARSLAALIVWDEA